MTTQKTFEELIVGTREEDMGPNFPLGLQRFLSFLPFVDMLRSQLGEEGI